MVFCTVAVLYYIVSNSAQDSIFTYILTNTSYFCLLIIAILMGKKWYLIVSFICILLCACWPFLYLLREMSIEVSPFRFSVYIIFKL